jgi:hypothetical protein
MAQLKKDGTPKKLPKGGSKKGTRRIKGTMAGVGRLTIEQEAYCRARALGMDMKESLVASGAKVTISTIRNKWEKMPDVRSRIAELSAIATENAILKSGLDREWVITRLMSVVDRCMQAEPVMINGEPSGEFKFDAPGANTALRMLGDTMGLFKPQETKPDDYANLTDEDIARITAQLAQETGLLIDAG